MCVDKSNEFFVFFFVGPAKAVFEPECMSGTWIGILVAVVIGTLLVILLLVLKICRSKGKKKGESLWAEQPLNTKASAEE